MKTNFKSEKHWSYRIKRKMNFLKLPSGFQMNLKLIEIDSNIHFFLFISTKQMQIKV